MTASGVELLDAGGHVLAELTPGLAPTRRSDTSAATDVPTPSAGLVARFRNAGTLPAGLTPATAATVVGQWRPDPQTKAPSSLTVKADGAWVGNDGCNDSGGAWLMATGGYLTATTGSTAWWGAPDPRFQRGGALRGGWASAARRWCWSTSGGRSWAGSSATPHRLAARGS